MARALVVSLVLVSILALAGRPALAEVDPLVAYAAVARAEGENELLAMRRAIPEFADPQTQALLRRVSDRLVKNGEVPEPITPVILSDTAPLAFALGNGVVAVSAGLLGRLENEAQLACVLGRELSHLALAQPARAVAARPESVAKVAADAAAAVQPDPAAPVAPRASSEQMRSLIAGLAQAGVAASPAGYGAQAEAAADQKAVALIGAAGYDLEAALRAWDVLSRSATPVGAYRYDNSESVRQAREEMERAASGRPTTGSLGSDRASYEEQTFEVVRWLGERMVEDRRYPEALSAIDRGLKARPDDLKTHYLRGLVLVASARTADDYGKAIGEFEWVLARNPSQATTHRDLGLSYYLAKQPERSLTHLRRYLDLDKQATDAAEIRKVIASLEQSVATPAIP